jgi:hypothetical protein
MNAYRFQAAAGFVSALFAFGATCAVGGCVGDEGPVMGQLGDVDVDRIDATCLSEALTLPVCGPGVVSTIPSRGSRHILEPTPIAYVDVPPSSGDHRPAWARWGEYDYLPPQRWLHNLEHGGLAFLYDPCAPADLIDALRAFARAIPDDDSGPFRWVLTPFPGLPTPIAVIAWEWTWGAACVDAESLDKFITEHYRAAPEDFGADGSYETGWLGR